MRVLAAFLAFLAILYGCVSQDRVGEQVAWEKVAGKAELPESIEYSARYKISDGSGEISKAVWRSGKDARIQYSVSGRVFADLFIISGRAFSCTTWKAEPECFEADTQKFAADFAFPKPDFSVAEPDEEVEIGGQRGVCFLFPHDIGSKRKMCFTQEGIVAYDEYPLKGGGKHVEYLAWLRYSVDPSDLKLPSQPKPMPAFPS